MRAIVILLLAALVSSCKLLGGATQVSFLNSTSFTLAVIQLGPLTVASPLSPSSQTGNYSIIPGQNVLTAESQDGTWTNAVLLSIAAGHTYTITFSGSAVGVMTVGITADN